MSLSISKRSDRIVQAEIRVMTIECEKVGGINLAQGVCDTGVPMPVCCGAREAMNQGVNSYTRFDGLESLREAIARKVEKYNGISANSETDIVVSAGSTGSFYCACLALLDPGDEVILLEPYYGYHLNTLLAVEAVPTYITMLPPDWTFSREDLERAITPKTKGIMVCTPANPSGKVFTETELQWIADAALDHDFFIFTDEIYEYIVYDGQKHVSPGSIKGVEDRTITISGYSKTYSITGWRIGYSVSDAKWAEMIGFVNDLVYVCAPAPLQEGVARGVDALDVSFYEDMRKAYAKKRELICNALDKAGLTPFIPQGAYYVLADATGFRGSTSKEKAMNLLRKTGVASVPGEAFYHGSDGENQLRFCFAKVDQDLEEACRRIEHL